MLGFIWNFIWALFSPCGVSVCWFVVWCLCGVKSVPYESEEKLNQYWEYVVIYAARTEKTEGGKKRLCTRFQIMLWNKFKKKYQNVWRSLQPFNVRQSVYVRSWALGLRAICLIRSRIRISLRCFTHRDIRSCWIGIDPCDDPNNTRGPTKQIAERLKSEMVVVAILFIRMYWFRIRSLKGRLNGRGWMCIHRKPPT